MIILPERGVCRAKLLMPVRPSEWRGASRRKTTFGIEDQTRFRLTARLNDGHVKWCGWFDDRDDADAFLFAMATGSLRHEPSLWRLPLPNWHSNLGENVGYDFATVTFLTSPTGSNQTYTSPSDWNNSNNKLETLGAGSSGGADSTGVHATGGAGGAYNTISNFTFATPGTTTATYQIGSGGAARVGNGNGNAGGDSWFNGATLGGASVGSKAGAAGVKAGGSQNGGAGGSAAGGVGSGFDGGRGGNLTGASGNGGSGAGGAAGSFGAGGAGADSSSTGLSVTTAGGQGDNTHGGAGGAASGANGGAGTEWDASHGSGGGGGGFAGSGVQSAGAGGLYGGGSAGIVADTPTSPAAAQGIIVVTYTAAAATAKAINMPNLGM